MLLVLVLGGCTRATPTPTASPPPVGTPRAIANTERKVDAILLEILETYRVNGRERAEQLAREAGVLGEDNLVRLTLVLANTNTAPVAQKITANGGQVTGISENILEIEVPLERWLTYLSNDGRDMMQDIAAFDAVHEVRVTPPVHPQEEVPPRALKRTFADFTTEGVKASGADRWQAAGYYGQGVKIGVIDVGFGGYEALIGTELPPLDRLQTRSFASDKTLGKERHGTGVAEIVHDMAPDASIWLVRIDTNLSTDKAIRWLVDEVGVDLISMSIGSAGYYRTDGSSTSAKAVDYAFSKGVLCIIAAGNEADAHYGATYADADGDGYHDVTPGEANLEITALSSQVTVILNWEAWSGPPIDLNLEVYDASGNLLRASNNVQNTSGRSPVEYVTVPARANQAIFARIKAVGEPVPVALNIYTQAGEPTILTPGGSLATPGDAKLGLSVAAARWDTQKLEIYSSQGPTADGRIKPDITGPTVVQTAAYGNGSSKFNGTSAATPHVTGAAALFLSSAPAATTEQIVQFLWGRARDVAPAGADNETGYGLLTLGEPPTAAAPPRTVAAPSAAPSASAVPATARPSTCGTRQPFATPTSTPTLAVTTGPTSTARARAATHPDRALQQRERPGTDRHTDHRADNHADAPFAHAYAPYGARHPRRGLQRPPRQRRHRPPGGWRDALHRGPVSHRPERHRPGRLGGLRHRLRRRPHRGDGPVRGGDTGRGGDHLWLASPQDYYLFAVTNDGYYQISHFQDGRWTALIPWTTNPGIVVGGPNRLLVETAARRSSPVSTANASPVPTTLAVAAQSA